MNSGGRRLVQRWIEFPLFRRLGLKAEGQDVLEVGCGAGYGAVLIGRLRPRSYVGVDLMPEQIELAQARGLPGAEFLVMDAAEMGRIDDASKDCVVIFGILHHIPKWREVLRECHRVLRPGGRGSCWKSPAAGRSSSGTSSSTGAIPPRPLSACGSWKISLPSSG
jgi:ubiquinone/menaquinone biosynthesis C-methylase UbiE